MKQTTSLNSALSNAEVQDSKFKTMTPAQILTRDERYVEENINIVPDDDLQVNSV